MCSELSLGQRVELKAPAGELWLSATEVVSLDEKSLSLLPDPSEKGESLQMVLERIDGPTMLEATALGAIFMAGLGVGLWRDTDALARACTAAGHPLNLRRQPGYDHSYYFIASFIGEHIAHHAEALKRAR